MRRYFDTFYYEVSKIPHLGDKLQGSRMGLWFLDSGVDFFFTLKFPTSANFRYLRIIWKYVPGKPGAHRFWHCPKCPEFWSLESVPF